jgi:hypothetical protein
MGREEQGFPLKLVTGGRQNGLCSTAAFLNAG